MGIRAGEGFCQRGAVNTHHQSRGIKSSSATGGGDDTIIPPIAEPSIDGKAGLYIPERPDLEDTLRPRVDDPE